MFSQPDTLRLDENQNQISKKVFYNKEKSSIYKGVRYSTDTLVIESLKLNYFYDKLSTQLKSQLCEYFSLKYNIDTTKTLIIHYTYSLKHPKDYPKKTPVYIFDSISHDYKLLKNHPNINLDLYLDVSRHMHAQNYRAILKGYKSCLKYHKKYDASTEIIHLYAKNEGFPLEEKELKWFSDDKLFINNIFSKIKATFEIVIIKPNGEYYVQYGDPKYDYIELISSENWEIQKQSYLDEVNYLKELK